MSDTEELGRAGGEGWPSQGLAAVTLAAGLPAGLEVVRIVNVPTAAALAYGIGARAARA